MAALMEVVEEKIVCSCCVVHINSVYIACAECSIPTRLCLMVLLLHSFQIPFPASQSCLAAAVLLKRR